MASQSNRKNHYELLGLSASATRAEIKAAYHHLVLKYHPDRNPDPKAVERTQALNDAYAVLSDDRRRQLYDEWLRASETSRPPQADTESAQETSSPAPDFLCSNCGVKDASLRLVAMYYVLSFLVVTFRRAASGIWCRKCRAREAAKWTFLSGIAGWWGVPWGPIYTLQALWINACGGLQPPSNNAALLRALAYQLYTSGRPGEAAAALRQSLRLETHTEASIFLKYLEQNCALSNDNDSFWPWRFAAALPSLLVTAVGALAIYFFSTQPSGYLADYKPPTDMATVTQSVHSGTRDKANVLIGQLAQLVESRAPVVGTHFEGSRVFRDYELDRSKYDPQQFISLADQLYSLLQSNGSNSDGFVASAYFDARLFALSVYVVNGIESGTDIDAYTEQVRQLGGDPFVSAWLSGSRFNESYSALLVTLDAARATYRPGRIRS